jgi:hypothetical protein
MLLACLSSKGQSLSCKLVTDTLYYTTIDVRSNYSNPIIMAGISMTSKKEIFHSKESASCFISDFYFNNYYVPDLYEGYKHTVLSCLGIPDGSLFLQSHPFYASKVSSKILRASTKKKIILKSGETVFLSTTKLYGKFWLKDINYNDDMPNSNEIDIKSIKQIKTICMPFDVKPIK